MNISSTSRSFHVVGNGDVIVTRETFIEAMEGRVVDAIYVVEKNSSGADHNHIYLTLEKPTRGTWIRKRLPGYHIEPARGGYEANYKYLSKEVEPYVYVDGGWQKGKKNKGGKGKKSKLEQAVALVGAGVPVESVVEAMPTMVMYYDKLDRYRQAINRPIECEQKVLYLYGPPGVGKTRMVYDAFGYSNVYRTLGPKNAWDSYRGESVIFIDDFVGGYGREFTLALLDRYPMMLPARYTDRARRSKVVVIASNYSVADALKEDMIYVEAFTRRLTVNEIVTAGNLMKVKEKVDEIARYVA